MGAEKGKWKNPIFSAHVPPPLLCPFLPAPPFINPIRGSSFPASALTLPLLPQCKNKWRRRDRPDPIAEWEEEKLGEQEGTIGRLQINPGGLSSPSPFAVVVAQRVDDSATYGARVSVPRHGMSGRLVQTRKSPPTSEIPHRWSEQCCVVLHWLQTRSFPFARGRPRLVPQRGSRAGAVPNCVCTLLVLPPLPSHLSYLFFEVVCSSCPPPSSV